MAIRTNEAKWVDSAKRWQINVQTNGTRRTFTSGVKGKKGKIEAERKADKWFESQTIDENIRLDKLWEDFLEVTKASTSYSNYLKHEQMGRLWLLPGIKTKKVVNITDQDWQDCIDAAGQKGLSKKSCKNVRASITALYRYAKKRRAPMSRPEDLTIPNTAPVTEKRILQPQDIKVVFSEDTVVKYGKPEKCFFIYAWRFILLTGLRRGELCGLRKEDIEGDCLFIRRSINSLGEETGGKTDNAKRYIVLSEHMQSVLNEQKQMLEKNLILSPWLFPDEQGGRLDPNHLYKKWNTYRKQHGINCSIHEMRHTLISIAQADVPEELLKRAVGHSKNMDTFGTYGHDVDGQMARVANIIDGIYGTILK